MPKPPRVHVVLMNLTDKTHPVHTMIGSGIPIIEWFTRAINFWPKATEKPVDPPSMKKSAERPKAKSF